MLGIASLIRKGDVAPQKSKPSKPSQGLLAVQPDPTLVIYVYSGSDPQYLHNLKFFIREAIKADDGCDYLIVIQEDPRWADPVPELPELPPNANVVRHTNECYDLGTVGRLFRNFNSNTAILDRYKYFFWVNSSVRGPYLPPYLKGQLHWTIPFTSKIGVSVNGSAPIKMVGPTLNCDFFPHLQSYVIATDREGLNILINAPKVFDCWNKFMDVILSSEIGASRAIIEAGFNLASLQQRYQGFNWQELTKFKCNRRMNPTEGGWNDGLDLNVYEVMFIKVKDRMLKAKWKGVLEAVKIDEWRQSLDAGGAELIDAAAKCGDKPANVTKQGTVPRAVQSGGEPVSTRDALKRGRHCFDWEFYLLGEDLWRLAETEKPAEAAWEHLVKYGVSEKEGRPTKWKCGNAQDLSRNAVRGQTNSTIR